MIAGIFSLTWFFLLLFDQDLLFAIVRLFLIIFIILSLQVVEGDGLHILLDRWLSHCSRMIRIVLASWAATVEVSLTAALDHHEVSLTILGALTSQQLVRIIALPGV